MQVTEKNVLQVFHEKFTTSPSLYFSPGRINLIGEHVDYNDGFVMPAAVNKGIYYAIAQNETNTFNFHSIDFGQQLSVDLSGVKKMTGWQNYVLSVLNEFILAGKPIRGFDCAFGGDIPRGAGMSSSAAVEGGLAFALNEIFQCGFSRVELALLCQRAEHNFPNVKCGIMDQFANMMGKKDHVLFLDCKTLEHWYLPLQLTGYKLVLINSKVHHTLASGEYNIRRQQCEKGKVVIKEKLALASFRDISNAGDLEPLRPLMDAEVYSRCRYVVEEIARTRLAAEYLAANKLLEFGKLMFATHDGLSKLYDVSCTELDCLVDLARTNAAVIGARLMGGGFGGCSINIVKEDSIEEFISAVSEAYAKKFSIIPEAYVVETGNGTGAIL